MQSEYEMRVQAANLAISAGVPPGDVVGVATEFLKFLRATSDPAPQQSNLDTCPAVLAA